MSDWRTMEAGRELDRLVGEKAGWRALEYNGLWYLLPPTVSDDEARGMVDRGWHVRNFSSDSRAWEFDKESPRFSTSVDAILPLVESFTEMELLRGEWLKENTSRLQAWRCYLLPYQAREVCGEAETAALAICRAWLAWMESQG